MVHSEENKAMEERAVRGRLEGHVVPNLLEGKNGAGEREGGNNNTALITVLLLV